MTAPSALQRAVHDGGLARAGRAALQLAAVLQHLHVLQAAVVTSTNPSASGGTCSEGRRTRASPARALAHGPERQERSWATSARSHLTEQTIAPERR